MSNIVVLLAVTASMVLEVSAYMSFGKCQTPELMTNFSRDKYVGRWFEQSKDAGLPFEWGQSCGTETYYKRYDGNIQVNFDSYA